ncbi:MAG: hypothetical protein IJ682_10245 [Lachnospiraceae bacterium]|nr:hypothetical protein [Lachnospiraceae bacterium]
MLTYQEPKIRDLLLSGSIGLEKESLRITGDGFFAKTPHPFMDDPFIVRDFYFSGWAGANVQLADRCGDGGEPDA